MDIEELHTRARCTAEGISNVSVPESAGAYKSQGLDNSFSPQRFKDNLRINITSLSKDVAEFDMINVDPPIANALRRILIAEVPTVATETVNVWQNTGVLHDEVLCHRLGLIPLNVDPEELEWRAPEEELTAKNAVLLKLHVKCEQNEPTKSVYASDFEWVPIGESQKNKFKVTPRPVHEDILITKLRPGQEIEVEMYAIKGVGKDHAKWSPVSTAWYRMCPEIRIPKPITGDDAKALKNVCPVGVFDIEDDQAVVANPRNCTTCRACIEKFDDRVEVNKIKTHFLFSVESVGSLPAATIFQRSIGILRNKMRTALEILRDTN